MEAMNEQWHSTEGDGSATTQGDLTATENSSDIVLFGSLFQSGKDYRDLKPIGLGGFGIVCEGIHRKTGQSVAIKKIKNPWDNLTLSKRTRLMKRAFRELMLLAHFDHENIISLKDAFIQPSGDLYLVTELLGTDLHRLMGLGKLEKEYTRFFGFQILMGLGYIHQAGVIHRDLKPANILVNQNCDLKICDFGLARISESVMTGYVSTRYYRAPEIMLTWQHYDKSVDLWSFGCILAEMVIGNKKPIFPGKDHIDQFSYISELLGSPPCDVVESISSESTLEFVNSLEYFDHSTFNEKFGDDGEDVVDLLKKVLVWDPKKRFSAKQCLSHEYFRDFYDGQNQNMINEFQVKPFDWSFTEEDLSCQQWNDRCLEIIDSIKQRTVIN